MRKNISRRTAAGVLLASATAGARLFGQEATSLAETEINPNDPHRRRRVKVHDSEMSYVDVGKGDPIVFLHGNPTSSYLWRNIVSQLNSSGRCLAPDLIGMGQSKPSPKKSYLFAHHARYLDAWFEAVGATKNVTLVVHDWGSVLGFHRAARFPSQIKAIAYMEALVMDRTWPEFGPFEQTFRALRSPLAQRYQGFPRP